MRGNDERAFNMVLFCKRLKLFICETKTKPINGSLEIKLNCLFSYSNRHTYAHFSRVRESIEFLFHLVFVCSIKPYLYSFKNIFSVSLAIWLYCVAPTTRHFKHFLHKWWWRHEICHLFIPYKQTDLYFFCCCYWYCCPCLEYISSSWSQSSLVL